MYSLINAYAHVHHADCANTRLMVVITTLVPGTRDLDNDVTHYHNSTLLKAI